jgi:hypothetical protein
LEDPTIMADINDIKKDLWVSTTFFEFST